MSHSNNSQTNHSRVPSRRDQEIFRRVVVQCELQYQVAKDLGLSPGRISQILTRVRRWLARGSGPSSPHSAFRTPNSALDLDATFSALEQQRLQRHLAQSRHEYLYQLSVREVHRFTEHPKHTTIRTETKFEGDDNSAVQNPKSKIQNPDSESDCVGQSVRRIVTVRDQPLNVQFIKTAQRSAIELQKLAELDPLPPPEVTQAEDRRALAEDLVTELLDDAAASDKVRSVGWDTEREFVEDLFKFLLGEPHRGVATNIIADDAQHGRFRPRDRAYPGRDPRRISPLPPGEGAASAPADAAGDGQIDSKVGCVESEGTAATRHSPDSALKNTKPHPLGARQPSDSISSDRLVTTPTPAATSETLPNPLSAIEPSEISREKSQNFNPPPLPQLVVRLTCPVVVNPP